MKTTRARACLLTCLASVALTPVAVLAAPAEWAPPGFHHVHPGNVAHIVALRFKPDAASDRIEEVCRAAAELPAKVPGIVDLSWGTNNSPEPFARGFTHLLLFTFADAATLEAYNPHPAHRAVVDLLTPILDAALVFDFPLEAESTWYDGQVKHVVLFKYKPDAAPDQVAAVREAFRRLPLRIPGTKDFQTGGEFDAKAADRPFHHAYVLAFTDIEARDNYLPHPAHKEFGQQLGPLLDEVFVIDFIVRPGSDTHE